MLTHLTNRELLVGAAVVGEAVGLLVGAAVVGEAVGLLVGAAVVGEAVGILKVDEEIQLVC